MNRLVITVASAAGACAIAVPAAVGLSGNPSFSHRLPVRVPVSAHVVSFDGHGKIAVDRQGPSRTPTAASATPRHIEPGDDNGRHHEPGDDNGRGSHRRHDRRDDRSRHVEPGDDRSRHTEPGDDRSSHVEPGDDRDGSGHGRHDRNDRHDRRDRHDRDRHGDA